MMHLTQSESVESQSVKNLRCEVCSHVQIARGIVVNGDTYFGSKRHFCDECDGHVSELTEGQSNAN